MSNFKQNLPNWLTYLRVILIPFFIFFYYFESGSLRYITCAIFVIASISDFLDGYLSRLWKTESRFGAMLDPIADKLIVATALCLIITEETLLALPVIAILCREIFISGLREFLGKTEGVEMPVSKLAKWKTASQMLAVIFLSLTAGYTGIGNPDIKLTFYAGIFILMISCLLTIITGCQYFRAAKEKELI